MIEINNLYKTYKNGELDVPVLHDVCLSVDKGEFVSIMGPSGSGKSTLMNIIGCLDRPTSGSYLFNGEDVSSMNDDQLSDLRNRGVGFVFQQFNLLPRETAVENVALPLIYANVPAKEREQRARAALERVNLSDRADFLPTQLSGGQKQRVAVARALVNNPSILLADEPTGALDSKSGEQLMELFCELNKQGTTIVMITHERGVASYAQRVLLMNDGILTAANKEEIGGIK
ncbi:MAG: ABC transporter ATP-binding protein [Oscillospiraceae bacterium]|nr:ABC transporter ATP-binding protein [Oscillospiraceae bacterium]MBR0452225.1 ABC transporter ATP-binding protein [Oscillospiraceae bacterium]